MEKALTPAIENRIFTIRGKQVMLDRDVAELFQLQTKRLNEQVKRNVERFPDHYFFRLTHYEKQELVANCDRLSSLKHSSAHPSKTWASAGLRFREWIAWQGKCCGGWGTGSEDWGRGLGDDA